MRAIVDAMLMPAQICGIAAGSTIVRMMSPRLRPKVRAMSFIIGSTLRTPYRALNMMGQTHANTTMIVFMTGPVWKSRSEEHTSELQSQLRTSYAVFCFKKKNHTYTMT